MEWLIAAIYLFQSTSPTLDSVDKVASIVGALGPTGLLGVGLWWTARKLAQTEVKLEGKEKALDDLQELRVKEAQASADVMLAFIRKVNPSVDRE